MARLHRRGSRRALRRCRRPFLCRAATQRPSATIPAPMNPILAIAAVVATGLAVYLVVAMLAPERFS